MGFFWKSKQKVEAIDKGDDKKRPVMEVVINAECIYFGPLVVKGKMREIESSRSNISIHGVFNQYRIDEGQVHRVGGKAVDLQLKLTHQP